LIKDENGDLPAYSHSVLNMWKNYFCQSLNVQKVNNVRWTEIHVHTAEQVVYEPTSFEVGNVTGIHYVLRHTNLLLLFGSPEQWNKSIRKGDKSKCTVIIKKDHFYGLHFIQNSSVNISSMHSQNYWGSSARIEVIDKLLIRYSAFITYWRKMGLH
jgi:hypothetical protein